MKPGAQDQLLLSWRGRDHFFGLTKTSGVATQPLGGCQRQRQLWRHLGDCRRDGVSNGQWLAYKQYRSESGARLKTESEALPLPAQVRGQRLPERFLVETHACFHVKQSNGGVDTPSVGPFANDDSR